MTNPGNNDHDTWLAAFLGEDSEAIEALDPHIPEVWRELEPLGITRVDEENIDAGLAELDDNDRLRAQYRSTEVDGVTLHYLLTFLRETN